jgi:hypothetical protein
MNERSGNVYEKKGLGTRGWGLGDDGLPIAGACQHHSLNLPCGSRRPTNLETELLFLTERSRNIYENKGLLLKKWERSWYVAENKGTYMLNVRMLLKTQIVSVLLAAGWERTGVRSQKSGVRMMNICLPHSAFCILSFCLPPTAC